MPVALPLKEPVRVGELVGRRLRELKRTPGELAAAVKVSEDYIVDLVAGRRRPPAPGRSDVYTAMTKFLRLHRNDLPACARAERRGVGTRRPRRPDARVRKLVLGLCAPERSEAIARRFARADGAELEALAVGRLLEVAQGFARRRLEDEVGLRVAATRDGTTYLDTRMRLVEFLDAEAESVTVRDCEEFLRPRIASWDMDFDTGAMHIVLR
jgi:hypothetical protein